ncbi:MAG: hypothetical protein VKS61_08345 [Candidatus Sericytochromatia bacterium]|nr:hypothetical protein [Candidatus Sericytochromatia bacterium]
MPMIVIGKCQHCESEVKADDKRQAAEIPILQRAAKLGRLTCKPCGAAGARQVDRDNPPDVIRQP